MSPHKDNPQHPQFQKRPQQFSVDCTHAANGFFAATVLIVLTIVGLIIFFIYMYDEDPNTLASTSAYSMDLILNVLGVVCVIYCAVQFKKKLRKLHIHSLNQQLDDGLLLLTMVKRCFTLNLLITNMQTCAGWRF